ncbi:MAG: ATP-binding cassette domain-containing protein [Pseudomonadota bacterium]
MDGLDLAVADGELLVMVGPSGCGKSTVLRMLAGLETISAGELRIGGRRVNELEPAARDVAMVFQDYALYPHMSVRENLDFPLRMRRMPKPERAARIARVADMLHLGELLERKPAQLSGGQRQRVAMGRALVREASVFLLDEPLSNLDAKLRVQVRAEIAELQRRLGTTMLYVTHDQTEAMTLGQRVAVFNQGRLQQVASPRELYERPANTFVAGFNGQPPMNILPRELAAKLWGNQNIDDIVAKIGLRPEQLTIAKATQTGLPTRLVQIEFLGHEILLYLQSGQSDSLIIMRMPPHLQNLNFKVGDHLNITSLVQPVFFDARGNSLPRG